MGPLNGSVSAAKEKIVCFVLCRDLCPQQIYSDSVLMSVVVCLSQYT